MNNNYPIYITQEVMINENDYIKVNIDINIDRRNPPDKIKIKTALENAVRKLLEIYN